MEKEVSDKTDEYFITSMEFKGRGDISGNYKYLLSFNKSLQHTGRLSDIEDGLNKPDKLSTLKDKVSAIKEKCLDLSFDKRDGMEGVVSEMDVKLCFNDILRLIEDELND